MMLAPNSRHVKPQLKGTPATAEVRQKAAEAKGPSVLTQIVELQAKLKKLCLDDKTSAAAAAQCARAWDVLEERRRIIRMKPKPRDLDVSDKVNSRKRSSAPPPLLLDALPLASDDGQEQSGSATG